jgi:hypothetical protein
MYQASFNTILAFLSNLRAAIGNSREINGSEKWIRAAMTSASKGDFSRITRKSANEMARRLDYALRNGRRMSHGKVAVMRNMIDGVHAELCWISRTNMERQERIEREIREKLFVERQREIDAEMDRTLQMEFAFYDKYGPEISDWSNPEMF